MKLEEWSICQVVLCSKVLVDSIRQSDTHRGPLRKELRHSFQFKLLELFAKEPMVRNFIAKTDCGCCISISCFEQWLKQPCYKPVFLVLIVPGSHLSALGIINVIDPLLSTHLLAATSLNLFNIEILWKSATQLLSYTA